MSPSNPRPAIEALLFASDQPLTLPLLADALEMTSEDVLTELAGLASDYRDRSAGVELREIAGGWVYVTAPEYGEAVARMLRGKRKMRLSRAALETLSIIAYKQPVTKSEVEAIRGVDASGVLATLLERNLVTVRGRSQVVGRPLLYGTTVEFLNYFGLKDLAELPRPEELRALVAAREPEQLEMMELDPSDGLPLAALNGATAAVADAIAGAGGEAGSAESAGEALTAGPSENGSSDDELAMADEALSEAGLEVAADGAVASDAGGDEDDDEPQPDFDDEDDESEDDEEDWDDDDLDEDDDDDDELEGDEEDEDQPEARLNELDRGR